MIRGDIRRNVAARIAFALIAAASSCVGAEPPARAPVDPASVVQTFNIDGTRLQLDLHDDFGVGTAPLVEWIERSFHIVADYYGRFPMARLNIQIVATDGRGVRGGTTWGSPALIRVRVGRDVTAHELHDDWVLVHEMIHLALPEVGRAHAWLAEGISTYVEGIARAQAGNRTETDVWSEHVHSMSRGLPQTGDQGLDRTHTWGRTYWGGALFCLLADVEIRSRTGNKFGLQDALRAVAKSSGGLATEWTMNQVMSTGDAAVGTDTLQKLYDEMKDAPITPDLAALWKNLGVESRDATISLRNDAPLATVREAIMRRPQR